jgi:tetratricopeptide (TPR) repeat protein
LSASVEAAAAAEQVYGFAEAQLQLERVLALWDRVPDAEQRAGADLVAVLSRCAEVAYTAGDNTRAVQLLRRALPLADEARQRQRAGLLHEQLARCLRALGDPDALGQQQEAVRLVKPEPSVERARVLGSLEKAATVALAGMGEASLRGLGHQPQTMFACNATDALFALGRWDEAGRISGEALELAPSNPASVNLPMARAALDLGLGNLDAEARLRTAQRLIPSPRPSEPAPCSPAWPSWPCAAATWSGLASR